jgi:photosystem II stability/assembly factor-like uncharacterized protein
MRPTQVALVLSCAAILISGCDLRISSKETMEPLPRGALTIPHWELIHLNHPIRAIAFSNEGTEGWAIGGQGLVAHYSGNRWSKDEKASTRGEEDFASLWLSSDGKTGWIVGHGGTVLHLQKGIWRPIAVPVQPRFGFMSVSSGDDKATACAVSHHLDIWCFENGVPRLAFRSPTSDLQDTSEPSPSAIAWGSSLEPAWAFSSQAMANSVEILGRHYAGRSWQPLVRIGTRPWHSSLGYFAILAASLTPDQSLGWAVGTGGTLLKYEQSQWRLVSESGVLTQETLVAVHITPDGSRAWAASDRGTMLSWDGQAWKASAPPELAHKSLGGIWLSEDGHLGRALTETGDLALSLSSNHWSTQRGIETLTGLTLGPVWCDGPSSAWMHGHGEGRTEIFHFADNRWKFVKDVPDPAAISFLEPEPWMSPLKRPSIALTEDGASGWSISATGDLLYYNGGSWKQVASKVPIQGVRDIRLSADGSLGLVLFSHGRLLLYKNRIWTEDHKSQELLGGNIKALWLNRTNLSGWVGSGGDHALRFQRGEWTAVSQPLDKGGRPLYILPTEDGEESLAVGLTVGGNSQVFRFQQNHWHRDAEINLYFTPDFDLWMTQNHRMGWIFGEGPGAPLALVSGRWMHDDQADSLRAYGVQSVCLAPAGETGWAVGNRGFIARYQPRPIGPLDLQPENGAILEELRGAFELTFKDNVSFGEPVKFWLDEQGSETGGQELLAGQEYDLDAISPSEFRLVFKSAAQSLVHSRAETLDRLRIEAHFPHPSLPVVATFETKPFYMHDRPLWLKALWGTAFVLIVNLALFFLAIWIPWVRSIVLHPIGSFIIGAAAGKFILTDWMIRFVLPLKLAMFRDYRKFLAETPALNAWSERLYISPQISLPSYPSQKNQVTWESVFRFLSDHQSRRLWLLIGQSGLGKTAILEKWTRLAIELKMTPILIRLRDSLSPKVEAAALMGQFGEVNVTPDVAQDLLVGGGFVILIDGLNEARDPDLVREFVRSVIKRNLVVLTSQFNPGWDRVMNIELINLEPFGRDQLLEILSEDWVARILDSPGIREIARLPYTAQLLAGFIDRNNRLPHNELEVYQELSIGLPGGELANLRATAWNLFRLNQTEISSGPELSEDFCESAVRAGILTRRAHDAKNFYRFVHERLHRLFVAEYLQRQDEQPLIDWHKEVRIGLGRDYWIDVFDFWGQIKGNIASHGGAMEKEAYWDFLRKAANFSYYIFKHRLYMQFDRLCKSCPGLNEPDFVGWAALFLAEGGED